MINEKHLLAIVKTCSSQKDEELIPLIDEYIVSGRRRRTILKGIIIVVVLAVGIGGLIGFMKTQFSQLANSAFTSGLGGGIIGCLSVIVLFMILKHDIKKYLQEIE